MHHYLTYIYVCNVYISLGKEDGEIAAALNYVTLQATILNMTASFITRTEAATTFSTIATLNAEISARQNADATETAARISLATNVIQLTANLSTNTANLNNEILSRINDVATLTTNLAAAISAGTTETNRAVASENVLNTNVATLTANLNNEISSRTVLSNTLVNLAMNLTTVTANLNTEITARTTLAASLTTEVIRASVAENSLALTITSNANSTSIGSTCTSGTSSLVVADQEYWIDNSVAANETISSTIVTANLNGYVLKVLGIGFSMYYNPQFQVSFICLFYNPAFGNKTSFGVVVYDPIASFLFYHVECPVPVISINVSVTISLYKSTGQIYPFGGFDAANILTVQYYWTSVATTSTYMINVVGLGFNVWTTQKYTCIFTGKNSTNGVVTISYLSPAATNLTTLNCGLTPAGFAVVSGTSTVNLTIFEANADNSTGYQVQPKGSTAITYSTCHDLVKDGDETDVDCGGSTCGILCSIGKNCLVNVDCLNYCTGGVCIASTVFFVVTSF